MTTDTVLPMSLPLDGDGFLRRECPTCEREFKLHPGDPDDEAVDSAPPGGYTCPYCRIQAPPDNWFTKDQVELAQNIAVTEIVDPGLEKLGRRLSGSSSSFLKFEFTHKKTPKMDPLSEVDDMRRVDVECHPDTPLKVLEEWDSELSCFICGSICELGSS